MLKIGEPRGFETYLLSSFDTIQIHKKNNINNADVVLVCIVVRIAVLTLFKGK